MMLSGKILFVIVASLIAAQQLAFNPADMVREANARRQQLQAKQPATHQASNPHGFLETSMRNFKVIQEGRLRTLRTTVADTKMNKQDIVYLAPASQADKDSETTVSEVVVEVIVEEDPDAGIVNTIVENLRDAYDQYLSTVINGQVTVNDIAEAVGTAARNALDWLGSLWGKDARISKALNRLAAIKVDKVTGDALIVRSTQTDVKVIRVGKVVFEASQSVLGANLKEGSTKGLTVSAFRFEAGDIILAAGQGFWDALSTEKILEALAHDKKSLADKANALVSASPKNHFEEVNFVLSIFE